MAQKRMLSGIKATGTMHIGNYLGAMRQWVELQKDYESFAFVADLHSLTSVQNGNDLRQMTLDIVLDYLAAGLDPEKVTLYKQSDIPYHTELCWIFNCITTMPYLMRAHAYKDAEARKREINVGTFDYPMLMAADILLYDADIVPVGQDQKQHLEFTRDTAEKFNLTYGETFKLPEHYIPEDVATIQGLDGRKMSKAYNNTIPLFGSDDEIQKGCMSIVTDSKGKGEPLDPETDNVFALHKHFSPNLEELRERYLAGTIGYKESKELLAENILTLIRPMREKREALASDKQSVLDILKAGGEKAHAIAEIKINEVREKIGTKLY